MVLRQKQHAQFGVRNRTVRRGTIINTLRSHFLKIEKVIL